MQTRIPTSRPIGFIYALFRVLFLYKGTYSIGIYFIIIIFRFIYHVFCDEHPELQPGLSTKPSPIEIQKKKHAKYTRFDPMVLRLTDHICLRTGCKNIFQLFRRHNTDDNIATDNTLKIVIINYFSRIVRYKDTRWLTSMGGAE